MRISVVAMAVAVALASASTGYGQVVSNGTRSTAIGVVNGNVVVNGPTNAAIERLARQLDILNKRNALSAAELNTLLRTVNASILPVLMSIRSDTADLDKRVHDLEMRVNIAAEHPETARDVLRPFLQPSFDLSNSSYDVSQFLDANGQSEYRLTFSLTGNCLLYVVPPRGAGFTVGYGIFSDHGTQIWWSVFGTQGPWRPLPLSTGVYQFVMRTKRNAGQYSATISARCT